MAEFLKANITIQVDDSQAKKSLKKVESNFKKTINRMKKVAGSLASAFKNAFSQMVKFAKIGALAIVASFALVVRAAMKQEDAVFGLAAALKNTGDASAETMRQFQDFASSIQKTTIFGDEYILSLISLQKNLGVSTDRLEEATRITIGLAAATGRNVESMAMYVALAQQGEFTMLRRYIPALRSMTDKTQMLAEVTRFAANGFKVAEARAKTTSGGLKQLWNTIGDVAEVLGAPLLDPIKKASKALKDFLEENKKRIKDFSQSLVDAFTFKIKTEGLGSTLKELVITLFGIVKIQTIAWVKNLGDLLIPLFVKLGQILKDAMFPISEESRKLGSLRLLRDIDVGQLESAKDQLKRYRERAAIDFGGNAIDVTDAWVIGKKEVIDMYSKMVAEANEDIKKIEEKRLSEAGFSGFDVFLRNIKIRSREANKESLDLIKNFVRLTGKQKELKRESEKIKTIGIEVISKEEKSLRDSIKNQIEDIKKLGIEKEKLEVINRRNSEAEDKRRDRMRAQERISGDLKDRIGQFKALKSLIRIDARDFARLGVPIEVVESWKQLQISVAEVNSSIILSGLRDSINSVTAASSDFFTSWIDGSKDMGDAFKDMTSNIKDIFNQMVSDLVAKWVIFQLITGIGNAFSPGAGSRFAAGLGLTNSLARTGVPRPGVQGPPGPSPTGFAKGGITSGLSFAGEEGPEAVIPLPDGRTVPVTMKGGGGTVVNVINQSSQEVTAETGESFFEFGNMVTEVILKDLENNGPVRNNLLALQ